MVRRSSRPGTPICPGSQPTGQHNHLNVHLPEPLQVQDKSIRYPDYVIAMDEHFHHLLRHVVVDHEAQVIHHLYRHFVWASELAVTKQCIAMLPAGAIEDATVI